MRRFAMTDRLVAGVLTLAFCVPLFGQAVPPAVLEPTQQDRIVSQIVTRLLEQVHISRRKADDEISKRLHLGYLDVYDPLKIYFTKADLEEFAATELQHDDQNAAGDLAYVFAVYNRFLERLATRVQWVTNDLVKQPHDFTKPETIVRDPKTTDYAANDEEAKDTWRKRVKYELALLLADDVKEEEARERITKRYQSRETRWKQLRSDEIVEMYLTSLTSSYDPHSTYMSPRTLDDFNISMQLSLEGIGALLREEDGYTVLQEIVAGGAAEKDGRLKAKDKIVGVGQGEEGEIVDIVDMRLRDVVSLIRGKKGTKVRLEVIPAGDSTNRVVYTLTRQKIELEDRKAKGEVITTPTADGVGQLRIGVIYLPSFYADTEALRLNQKNVVTATNDCRKILEDFNKQGVDAVLFDLRNNGGGLLSEAIDLTGLFIDEGPVVQVRDFDNNVETHNDETKGVVYRGPLVVLINKVSASASEIFAGAIKDYGRGLVIGDSSTHGKGTVQKVLDLNRRLLGIPLPKTLGALKVTMQQFYRVNGESTQNAGVPSDVVLPAETDNKYFGESELKYALEFHKIDPAKYVPMNAIPAGMIANLQKRSADRFANDPELGKLIARKAKTDERLNEAAITFTLASLKAEKAELADGKTPLDEEAAAEEEPKKKDEPFGSVPYEKEALRVTADYLSLGGAAFTAR